MKCSSCSLKKMAAPNKKSRKAQKLHKLIFKEREFKGDDKWIRRFLEAHAFNHSLEVTLPGSTSVPESLSDILKEEKSYVVYDLPVVELTHPDLIGAFIKAGKLCMLSHGTRLDVNNCVSVLPTGHLILHLTKDVYTKLGLEGNPSQNNKYGGEKYIVQIDVGNESFIPGKKGHSRIRQRLQTLDVKFTFLISWTPDDDELCPSSIQKYFKMKGFSCVQLPLKQTLYRYKDLEIPVIEEAHPLLDNMQEELYDWLGGVASRLPMYTEDGEVSPVFDYSGPREQNDCVHYQCTGMISSSTVIQVIENVRKLTDSSKVWISVSIHGFVDSPTTMGTVENGLNQSSSNSITLVIFKDKLWIYR